jgi:hypothetical protein
MGINKVSQLAKPIATPIKAPSRWGRIVAAIGTAIGQAKFGGGSN